MKKKESFWYAVAHQEHLNKRGYIKLVRRVYLFIGGGFAVSLAVFIILALIGGIDKVIDIILSSRLYIYALAFASVFLGYMLRFIKWNYFLKVLGLKVPFKKNISIYMSLYSMNITPGKIGRVIAAYTLNRVTKIGFANIVPIVTMDIFTDFMGFAVVALLAALYFHKFVTYVALIDIALLLPFVFILNDWLYNKLKKAFGKSRFIKTFTLYGEEYYQSQSKLNSPKVYAVSMLVTVPAAILNSMTLFFALLAIGVTPAFSGSVFVYSSSLVFGMISAVPGNIGVEDAALAALASSMFHLSASISSAVTIMTRLAELWFGVILGGAFLLYTLKYWSPHTREQKPQKNRP